jgi:type 1 fimbria pilin
MKSKVKEVPLGEVLISDFDSGVRDHFVYIALENCSNVENTYVTFGDATQATGGLHPSFPLTPESKAKGVGVGIRSLVGTESLVPGQKYDLKTFHGPDGKDIYLYTSYEMTGQMEEIEPGDANAIVDIKITTK